MSNKKNGSAVILLYHQVGVSPVEQTNLDCFCDQICFEEQMSYLNYSHFKVISLEQLVSIINSHSPNFHENYVVLTFDDGCNKFPKSVLPILKKYNFPCTIYPVVGCLGSIANWPNVINPDLNILSKSELEYLSTQKVNIGAHTMNHTKLSSCGEALAKNEILNSKRMLEEIVDKEITSISYPHGDYNADIISLVKSLGFSNAVTCISSFVAVKTDLFQLPRKYITYSDTIETFKKIITYE